MISTKCFGVAFVPCITCSLQDIPEAITTELSGELLILGNRFLFAKSIESLYLSLK